MNENRKAGQKESEWVSVWLVNGWVEVLENDWLGGCRGGVGGG